MKFYPEREPFRNRFQQAQRRPARVLAVVGRLVGPVWIHAGRPQRRIPVFIMRPRVAQIGGAL